MKSRPFIAMVLLLLMLLSQFLAAQTVSFKRIKTPEGSPISGWITGITQDKQGYVWFSSSYAIHRYDGYGMKTYAHDASNSNSLAPGNIEAICADRDGFIWIGTQASGVQRLDPATGNFTSFKHNPKDETTLGHNFITCIIQDPQGTLWIGTHGGLDKLDPSTGKFDHYRHDPDNPTSLSNDQVRTLYVDRKGVLWVGTGSPFADETPEGEGGLNRMDRATGTFTRYLNDPKDPTTLIDNRVRAIFEDSQGTFWIGTFGDGLHTMNRDAGTFQRHQYMPSDPEKLSRPYLQIGDRNTKLFNTPGSGISFITEAQGEVWIGVTVGGLNAYNLTTKKMTHYEPGLKHANGLLDQSFWSALTTRDGKLFLGTSGNGDIYSVSSSSFHLMHYETERAFTTFFKDASGDLWMGSAFGLHLRDQTTGQLKNIAHQVGLKADDWVHILYEDIKGTLWIGSHEGLTSYNAVTKRSRRFRYSSEVETTISSDTIVAIYEDRDGRLWIGTDAGLDLMDRQNNTFSHYKPDASDSTTLSGNRVVDILEDRRGNLWVITRWSWASGTLNKLDRRTGKVTQYPKFTDVVAIAEDSSFLWIASRNNLYRMSLDNEVVTRFTDPGTGEGILSIQNILHDKYDNLWVNTVGGLLHISPDRDKIRKFITTAGNNATGAYQGKRNFYESPSGEVFFGHRLGIYSFSPGQLPAPDTRPPEIVFHNFRISGGPDDLPVPASSEEILHRGNLIELSHQQDGFSIDFAGIHYGHPELNKHLFKLDGYDNIWHQSYAAKTAYYYSLPPGSYTFRVKASNGDGVWAERSLPILIHPPWWLTWWAYALYVTTFAIVLFAFIRYRIHLQSEKLLLERKDWEARELKELDEMKTRFFSNITHEFRTPLSLIIPAAEQLMKELSRSDHLKKLSVVKRQAGQLLHLINQLLDLSKLEGGSMATVEQRGDISAFTSQIVDSFRPALEEKEIRLEMENQPSTSTWYFDADKWEKIVNNILSNAFKFTPAGGKIKVTFELVDSTAGADPSAVFTVQDNGPGISPEKLPHIFDRFYQVDNSRTRGFEGTGIGLALVKEMVELLKGTVRVESVVGQGTKFIITLPIKKAEADSSEQVIPSHNFVQARSTPHGTTSAQQNLADEDLPLILVVEDHSDLRDFIAESLNKTYRVLTAATGKQGLALSQEHLPDIVVSDVMMPEMDGFELTNLIKKGPDTNHIAVVLLTARAAQESRLTGLGVGADDYLTKPFHLDELILRIRNIIDRQQKLQLRYQQQLKLDASTLTETVQDKFWQSVCNAIETQLDNPVFDVDALAASVNTSRRTLYRKLATLTGLKPNEVIRDYRLKRAKQFLTQGLSVSETAYRVGFESPSYFGKCFKETYQITPSEYLQKHMAQMSE